MKIYLLGYMGSGKSTVGKKLARALNLDFIDLDEQIEMLSGQSVDTIFEQQGEEAFRMIENLALDQSYSMQNVVVALGGGTPCFSNNLKFIKENGFSVYLKLSATSLAKRLQEAKKTRPLIKGLSDGELFEFVQQQLGEREKYYNEAHIIVKGENLNIKELVNLIENNA